jgi:hypothetical protein
VLSGTQASHLPKVHFNIIISSMPKFLKSFVQVLRPNVLILIFPMLAVCVAHLILDFIIVTVFSD